jgi:Protein of unknown function (DUF3592)
VKILFGSTFSILSVIFLVIACPFMAVGAGVYYYTQVNTRNWVLVKGTITGLSESQIFDTSNDRYSTSYCPSVAYQTTEGQNIDLALNECSSPAAYATGESVEVYYNPQDPQEAQLKSGAKSQLA